jgi:hypothetical protein
MKNEYHEGPEAVERFEKLGREIFRAPKTIIKEAPPKPIAKPKKTSKD